LGEALVEDFGMFLKLGEGRHVWVEILGMGLSLQRCCPDGDDDEVRGGLKKSLWTLVHFRLAPYFTPVVLASSFFYIFNHEVQNFLHQPPNHFSTPTGRANARNPAGLTSIFQIPFSHQMYVARRFKPPTQSSISQY